MVFSLCIIKFKMLNVDGRHVNVCELNEWVCAFMREGETERERVYKI